ncbi:MAG: DUF1670 domain-containing protein [Bacteroidetes bacterium]|nr:DUF1670 domain-containing protein [Bacteroidota bacterium]
MAHLRKKNITLPLRSTIKDMGRSITHRAMIVQSAFGGLQGKDYTDISRSTPIKSGSTYHSVDPVERG